jgi:putative intracellular protease/amidase
MASDRAVYVIVFDGFADWEPAHALAELRRWGKRVVRSVGFTRDPVTSMGGLRVLPDLAITGIRTDDIELLIIPGGDMWQTGAYPREALESLIASLLERETPVAAICAGTLALARTGALNDRRHTSNMRPYLSTHVSEYSGTDHYVDVLAVRDRHVITASGLGSVDFAREIFAELDVLSGANQELWYDMFKHGKLPQTSATPQRS